MPTIILMKAKGYQLIETDLTGWVVSLGRSVAIATLCWIVDTLKSNEPVRSWPVEVELINAEYMNKYPCVAVHYLDADVRDIGPQLEAMIDTLFREGSHIDFLRYCDSSRDRIQQAITAFERYPG